MIGATPSIPAASPLSRDTTALTEKRSTSPPTSPGYWSRTSPSDARPSPPAVSAVSAPPTTCPSFRCVESARVPPSSAPWPKCSTSAYSPSHTFAGAAGSAPVPKYAHTVAAPCAGTWPARTHTVDSPPGSHTSTSWGSGAPSSPVKPTSSASTSGVSSRRTLTGTDLSAVSVSLRTVTACRVDASSTAHAISSPSVDAAPVSSRIRCSRSSSAARCSSPPRWAGVRESTRARTPATASASAVVRSSTLGSSSMASSTGATARSMPKLSKRRGCPSFRMS